MSALYGTYARSELAFERGEGVRLYTADGAGYLDFAAGIGVNALGHAHPALVETLRDQGEKLWHVSNLYHIPQQERLAARLVASTFADLVFFTNSGAEAVECAIKTARRYFFGNQQPEKFEIIAFGSAFHGRTLTTISAAANPVHIEGFGPLTPGFVHLESGDLAEVEKAIGPQTAAILIEPVQGEGGVNVISEAFLAGLRTFCDRHALLLIFDEVQSGYGRTGRFFAHEWAGIVPDIMAVAKGIGGGFPLGACLATKKAGQFMVPGTHGSTFGGNPLACAIGNAVLDVMLAPGFFEHVEKMGQHLAWSLRQLAQKYPDQVLEVRGKGLFAGIRLAPDVREFSALLRTNNLLTVAASGNVLRLLPPLIVQKEDVDQAIGILDQTLAQLSAKDAK